jgi:hypothetical protein
MDMKAEEKILAKYGRDTGYRAPEGFLDAAFEKISAAKGDLPKAPELKPRTRWQIVRPYVYLAAMFAGIWCTMKIFSDVQKLPQISLDNMPTQMADAMQEENIYSEVSLSANLQSAKTDYELESDLQESFEDFDDFAEEFDYDFSDQYENLPVEQHTHTAG